MVRSEYVRTLFTLSQEYKSDFIWQMTHLDISISAHCSSSLQLQRQILLPSAREVRHHQNGLSGYRLQRRTGEQEVQDHIHYTKHLTTSSWNFKFSKAERFFFFIFTFDTSEELTSPGSFGFLHFIGSLVNLTIK